MNDLSAEELLESIRSQMNRQKSHLAKLELLFDIRSNIQKEAEDQRNNNYPMYLANTLKRIKLINGINEMLINVSVKEKRSRFCCCL